MKKNEIINELMKWCDLNGSLKQNKITLSLNSFEEVIGLCIKHSRTKYVPERRLNFAHIKIERLTSKLKEYKQYKSSMKILTRNFNKNMGW